MRSKLLEELLENTPFEVKLRVKLYAHFVILLSKVGVTIDDKKELKVEEYLQDHLIKFTDLIQDHVHSEIRKVHNEIMNMSKDDLELYLKERKL